ncbi:NADH-quinone oxidoreductase subunit K [Xanthobacter sp. AM11]|uniref:NADH-quinone oxidoreductase subunit K n=1 Tax=Xanthobacter sp. AM11 TaxID=3380643 RepID=UPI0039BF7408
MTLATLLAPGALMGLAAAALVGLGLYGLITAGDGLRRILGFNILGGGVFLLFGVVARRGAGAGFGGDPVPQALVITGIVVAFCATALAAALLMRLAALKAAAKQPSPGGGTEEEA